MEPKNLTYVMTDVSDADLSQRTTWIFRISAPYAGLNLRSSDEAIRTRAGNHVSRGPKADSQPICAWATFIMNLPMFTLDYPSDTESQSRVLNVRYFLISNLGANFEF